MMLSEEFINRKRITYEHLKEATREEVKAMREFEEARSNTNQVPKVVGYSKTNGILQRTKSPIRSN